MNAGLAFLLLCFIMPYSGLAQMRMKNPHTANAKSTDAQTRALRTVLGKIVDLDRNPIAGALVVLENPERQFRKEQKSDADGNWKFVNVAAMQNEVFRLSISADGFLTRTGSVIFSGNLIQVPCVMNRDPRLAVRKLLAEGDSLHQAGEYTTAKAKYQEVLAHDMNNAIAELGIGLCDQGLGDLDAAREKLEKAVGLARALPDPATETAALEHLGDLLLRRLDLDGALRNYLEALELGFERTDFLALKVADTYRMQQKPAQALAYYRKALNVNPALQKDLQDKMRELEGGAAAIQEEVQPPAAAAATPEAAIPTPGYDQRLQETLRRAAGYCRKLEKAAFRYYCLEDIAEEIWPGRAYAKRNAYRYDFQIVGGKKRISEKRRLLLENGQKASAASASSVQKTIFKSQLKFFAPVEMLGADNQRYFHYHILREVRIDGEPFLLVHIEARRPFAGQGLLQGSALVSPADGSILRIDIAQNCIAGVDDRRRLAREAGFDDVIIRDSHWFEKREAGLRFPSRSEMQEIYLKDQMQTLHYTVSYSYSGYKFFGVKISGIQFK